MRTYLFRRESWSLLGSIAIALVATQGCRPFEQPTGDGLATQEQAIAIAAWAPGRSYAIGAKVSFDGIVYQCRQAHRSQSGFEPPRTPALWMRPTPAGISEWTIQTNYVRGSGVTHNGALFECLQAHVSDSKDWTPENTPALWRCASHACGGGGCGGLRDGSLCDDGNPCTTDVCKAGACRGTPVASGVACSDGNLCNGAETCNASGVCTAGTPPDCDDKNACTTDSCTPTTGCQHHPVAAGSSCNDDDACNGAEVCDTAGRCLTGVALNCDDANPCTVDSCDRTAGCSSVPAAAGASCADSDRCNGDETCDGAGACTSGAPVVCNPGVCETATCTPATGACVTAPAPAGTACGPAQFCDSAQVCQVATLIPRTIPQTPDFVAAIPGFPAECLPGLTLGPRQDGPDGQPAYASISFATGAPPPLPACRKVVQFCDENESVLPTQPTDGDIGGPPSTLVQCPPLNGPTLENCNIDPATVGDPCSKDADCAAGKLCGLLCTTPGCETPERRCGSVSAGCAGQQDNFPSCDPRNFRICADPKTVVTVTGEEAAAQVPPKTAPDDSSKIPDNEKFVLPPFQPVEGVNIACIPEIAGKNAKQSSPWSLNLGSDAWGLFAKFFVENHSKVHFSKGFIDGFIKGQGDEQFDMGGAAGFKVGGKIFGDEITAVSGQLNVSLSECDKNIGLELKIFGESVAVLDTVDGAKSDFSGLVKSGDGLQTDPEKKNKCNDGFTSRNKDASDLKKTMFVARQAVNFYKDSGASEDFCKKTNKELHLDPPLDCKDPADIRVPNAWIDEYNRSTDQYAKAKTDFIHTEKETGLDAHLNLFSFKHPYDIRLLDQQVPIGLGPITLSLAFEFIGSWHVFGFLDAGVRYEGNWKALAAEVVQEPFAPLIADLNGTDLPDIRIMGGPRFEAGADVGVLAFAGLGIPGVSVGIEGEVNLLDLRATLDGRVAAVRRATEDTRPLTGTDYAGTEKLPRKSFNWHYAYSYGGKLTMDALNGQIDAAARIRVLFFKKTFKYRIAKLTGFSRDLLAVGKAGSIGGNNDAGDALTAQEAYGALGDAFAFSDIAPLTSTDIIANPDIQANYAHEMDRNRACIIVP